MPDVEYILRIILRARDEMAAVLAKARTQLRGFAADADKMNLSVDKLNKSMSAFNTNMDGVSKKLESWRAVLRDAGRDSEKAAKSIDNVGKSAQRSATSTQRAAQTQEQLQKAARNLRKEVGDLTKARDNEVVSAKFAAAEYERLSKELEKVSLNMSNAARTKTPAQTWALQAKEAAEQIKQTDKEITDDAKAQTKQRETNAQEAERIRLANVKAHNKQVEQEILDQIGRQEAAEQRRVAMIKLSNAAIGREIEQQIKDEVAASKNAEQEKARIRADGEKQRVAMVKLANSQIAAEIERQLKDEEAHANREANIKRLTGQRGDLNKAVLAGGGRVDREQARRLAQDFDKLSRSFENGSSEARHWAQEAANVKGVLSSLESDTGRAGSAVSKFAHAAEGGANSAGRMGNSIGALDNQARGLGLLLVIGSMQQLISVAISLGGELVSLASSAAMAGGALGGILAAGAAQALPVFGLLAGAMQRVKSVFDVFQQSQKLQQAQFTDAEKAGQKQIDTTNQLANATDNQSEAQDRLAESRKALNQANADGVRQLEDLIYQEKAAALAAQGASLNVKEAQKALQDAISGGASALEIQQRQQSLDEARQGAGRSRVTATRATEDRQAAGGRVGGLESVQNAQKAVKDAEQGLVRANRALDQAADKTDRVASSTMTAQANLDYLLSQLSPAERRLYFAFQSLYNNYKRIFQGTSDKDGIYGVIVDSFTRAVKRVNQIIQQPDVITSIQNLANSIGAAFNKITDSFTDTKTIDQFQQIIGDAGENLGPLVDMATDLGHAFLNIAETANPAFQDLIKYVGPIVDKFLALTADKGAMEDFFSTGEKHLESWLDLFLAVGGLFAALIGASAGEGKKSIEDLTKLIDGWTDKLKSNGDKVRDFFKQAREGAFEILGVLVDLGKTLFGSFDPDTISNFADILHKSVIPALGDVIEVVGKLSDFLSNIADNKYGAEFLRYGLAFLFFAQMAASSLAALRLMGGLVRVVGDQFGHLRDGVRFLRGLPGQLDRIGKSFQTVGKMAEEMGGKYTLVGKAMLGISRAMEAMRAASALMFGPWGIAAAIIIVGVVLLLKHFHKLDDVWRGLKAAFKIFLDAIQPALKSLQDALEDMGVHVGSFKDALSVVEAVGKRVADFITVVLVEAFKGLAHVLAGVAIVIIRVFTGIINIIHGIVDVIIGIFTGDWDQVLHGLENLVKGIVDIMGGVIEGIVQVFEGLIDIFLAPFKAAWEAVKDLFGVHSPSTLAAELGRDIIHGLVAGARGAVRALGRLAGWVWDKIRDGFHALGGAIRRVAGWIIDKFIDFIKAEIRGFKAIGEWIWNAIKDSVRAVGNLAKGIAGWLWDKFTGFIKREIQGFKNIGTWIYNALSDAIHGIGSKLEDIGSRLIKAIIKGIKSAPKIIHEAIEWLIDKAGPAGGAIRKALNFVSVGDGYAEGGPVPGVGSGDSVPAMLTPGEHVLTKAEVQAAGGHAAIFAFRALLGGGGQGGPFGFANGGGVTAADVNIATGAVNPQKRKADLEEQRKDYKRSNDQRAIDWHTMWNDMSTTARRAANDIEAQFRDMRDNTSKSVQKMYFNIRGSLSDIQKSFDVRGKKIVGTWSDNWMSLMKVTNEGLFYIGHETNKALTALGEHHINFGLSAPTKPADGDGKAAGGWIGNQGQRGKDRGLYPLGAGEAVLNWAHQSYVEPAMNAFYGHGLGEMFGRVRGYHAGGPGQAGYAAGRYPNFGTHPANVIPGIAKLIELLQKKFPLLSVTSTTDHGYRTTTGGISDHTTGHAVDLGSTIPYMAKVTNFINSSGLWKQLKQGIHNPGLAVDRGKRVSGPGFFAAAWPQHVDHIHLALAGALGHVAGAVTSIARRIVTPRNTATARLVQAAVDRVRKSANQKVTDAAAAADSSDLGAEVTASGRGAAEKVFNFFKGHHLSDAIAAGFAGVFQKESNFNTTVLNKAGSGATGLAQWLGGRLTALKSKPNWQSLQTQLNFVWEELMGPESGAFRQIKTATSPAQAATIIDRAYERSDHILSAPAYAENWYRHFAQSRAAGGIIDGPDGAAVPILGHAGEWVLNKGQQLRAAMLSGLSVTGLKSMLGFHGGPTGFQGGGEIGRNARILGVGDSLAVGIQQALKNTFRHLKESVREGISSGEALRRLKENWKSAYRAVIFDAGTNDSQAKTFARNLKRAHKIVDSDQELIVSTLKGGPQAAAKNRALRKFARENENVRVVDTSGIPLGPDNLHPTAAGYRQRAQLFRQAIRQGSPAADSARLPIAPVTTLKTLFADFDDTWKGIAEISRIMRQQRRAKKLDATKIAKDYQEIIGLIDNITGSAGIEAVANTITANLARTQAKLKRAAYRVMAGGRVRRVIQDGGDLDKQLAALVTQAHGLYGERSDILDGLKLVNKQLKKVAGDKTLSQKQRQTLVDQLEGQRKNLLDNQDRINSEIADSVEARWQAMVDIQQKAVDDINKRHEDRSATLDLSKRVFTALGNQAGVDRINTWIAANVRSNINDLTGKLAAARKVGNYALVDTLTKQIAELQVQVTELAAAALQEAIDAIAKTGTRQRASLDLFGRMADAMGIVGNAAAAVIPGVGGVGGLGSMSRAQVAQGRVNADIQERAGYIGQLGTARAQGNIGQIEALTDKINELTVSIVENTKAARDARFAATQDEFDFNTSINDLNKQLVEATDAATNQTSSTKLLKYANDRQNLLLDRGIEIQNQLTEAINEGDVKASRDLQRALLENQIAVQQNTKAVADLTGAGSAPSTFTSTLWQWFGEAFLTGTGGIIPQYLAPSNLMAGLTGGGANAASSSSVNNGDTNINIEINEAGQPIDPTRLASTVVFAQATASN